MLDTFIATRERPMRVLLTDSVGAVVAGVLFLLFGSWGMSVPTVLYYPVIALLCVRRSAPLVFLWGTTVLSGIQYFSAAYYFDVIVYGVTLIGVFGMAAFGARKLRWTCAVPPVLAITVVALQTLTPWMTSLPFSMQPESVTNFRERLQAFALLAVVIAIAFIAAWALGMLRRQQLVEVVRAQERAELMERDAHRMAELAVSDERSRISREMHDIIAHSLASIVTLAEGAALLRVRSRSSRPSCSARSATPAAAPLATSNCCCATSTRPRTTPRRAASRTSATSSRRCASVMLPNPASPTVSTAPRSSCPPACNSRSTASRKRQSRTCSSTRPVVAARSNCAGATTRCCCAP